MRKHVLGLMAAVTLSLGTTAAQAQVKFGICYDLSKAYTFVTPQIVQAAKDYADVLNAKGGLEGQKIEIVVQDHGNEPQRGIECYEKLKREGVMIFDTLSTPVSRAVLPRVMQDQNILLQSFVGRGDAMLASHGQPFRSRVDPHNRRQFHVLRILDHLHHQISADIARTDDCGLHACHYCFLKQTEPYRCQYRAGSSQRHRPLPPARAGPGCPKGSRRRHQA